MRNSVDIPKPDVFTVSDKGKITIAKDHREFMTIEDGDKVVSKPGRDNEGPFIKLRKLVLAIALVTCIMAMPGIFTVPVAFGQAVIDDTTYNTGQTQDQQIPADGFVFNATDPATGRLEQIVIQDNIIVFPIPSENAHVPFSVQVTFESGRALVATVSGTAPGLEDHYQLGTKVGSPNAALSTTTFSTEVIDTFELSVGQKYSQMKEQTIFIRINANGTTSDPIQIPITGTEFLVQFKFVTSVPPHFPTPEETAAAFREPLLENNRLIAESIDTGKKAINGFFTNSAFLQAVIVILIIISALLVGAIVLMRHESSLMRYFYSMRQEEENPQHQANQGSFWDSLKGRGKGEK